MSIGGLMRTSVSGMNAQATRLAGVSDNIANANTTGYKRQTTEFSTMVLASGGGIYNSGVVEAQSRQLVSQQGGLSYTTNATTSQAVDLAIQGKGFLVVSDGAGGTFLTRAGSFVKNGNGDLVNSAGYVLQGYPLPSGEEQGVLNGFAGLKNVNLDAAQLRLKATDAGLFRVNLPKDAPVVPVVTPAKAGTVTQANDFRITGYTTGYDSASPTPVSDTLTFTVTTVDGGTSTPTNVTVTPASGNINSLTLDEVVSQINAQVGSNVASASGGKLVLTAATPGHSISMTAAIVNGATGSGTLSGMGGVTGNGTVSTSVGTLPGANGADARFTATKSMVVYDDSGKEVILDIFMTKRVNGAGDTPETNNVWEYAVFDRSKAATGATAPFPYASGPLTQSNVTFDPSGKLLDPQSLQIGIPNGQSMLLDIAGTSQVGSSFEALAASTNGNPPGNVDQIEISDDGIVSAKFKSGALVALFKIPLAMVESPDNLRAHSGNVFSAGQESGEILLGFGGQSGLGSLVHGALELSTVDLASELTTMIESQRSYTANSKVFQTGSEILDVLVNLKR